MISGSVGRQVVRLAVTILGITVVSIILAGLADSCASLVRSSDSMPAALRRVAAYLAVAVRSGVPIALAWGLGLGPVASVAAGVTAALAAAASPYLSVVMLNEAEHTEGTTRAFLGVGSVLLFLVPPTIGALVGGLTSRSASIRSHGQRWGLTGGFTVGCAGAVALGLSWQWLSTWKDNPLGELVVLGTLASWGGLAGVAGLRLGKLFWPAG